LEDIDGEYIEQREDTEEAYFIFDESLKILGKYFRKLADWHNDCIYVFYFQLINLYYSYEFEQTEKAILEALVDKPE
jgi:hypothetical protein